MPSTPIIIRPGINRQMTKLLNEAGWSFCNLIRFKDSMLQKYGGWGKFSGSAVTGICRGLLAWQDLSAQQYLAAGTNKRVQLFAEGDVYDITPLRAQVNITVDFSTTSGDNTVTVVDVAHGGSDGDGIFIVTPISVGGIIIHGYYEITVVDADTYTIEAADAPTASVANGGATAIFTTTAGSATVGVQFADHGYVAGEVYTINVSTTSGGLTLFGEYVIATVVDDDNFTITASANAAGNDTDSENGGDVRISYLIASGLEDAEPIQGWGIGGWGEGLWGYGADSPANAPPRAWYMASWGEDAVASYTNGPIYEWDASAGLLDNQMTEIANAPSQNTAIFLAMPQKQIVALGAEDAGSQDPLLVKWCDVGNYSVWRNIADPFVATSQAGFYRIPKGARLVGGIQGPQQGLIWTDVGLWVMQYIGPPFLYSFNEVGSGCGLIGPRAVGVVGGSVLWMGRKGFFRYDGGQPNPVPCAVWDEVFDDLNTEQIEKIIACPNSSFNEMAWHFPSADSTENDKYVKLNVLTGEWDYGDIPNGRTAWIDQNVWGEPIGSGSDGYIYQHETGNNADTEAMDSWAETGWFMISEGNLFIFIERMIPDLKLSTGATVKMTIKFADYPNEDDPDNLITTKGPYNITAATKFVIVRGRGRMASIRVESDDEDSFWRLGKPLYFTAPAGKR